MISDYNGIDHIDPGHGHASPSRSSPGVNAGIDMFMQPANFEQFETALIGLVNVGPGADGAHR